MSGLTGIYIGSNSITGTISTAVSNMVSLKSLILDNNNLRGTIPSTIVTMTQLIRFDAYQNSLVGTIPSNMYLLTALTHLDLKENYLSMGGESSLPTSTFSAATRGGTLILSSNCINYYSPVPGQTALANHCLSGMLTKIENMHVT